MRRLSLLNLSMQTIKRRVFRTSMIIICVGMMTGTLFSVMLFMEGVGYSLRLGTARLGADLMVVPLGVQKRAYQILLTGEPTEFYMDRSVVDILRAMPEIKRASSQLYIESLEGAACCTTGRLLLVAIDPETDFTITPWLREKLGRPFSGDEAIKGINVVFGAAWPEPIFFGHKFKDVGTLEPTGMGLDESFFITFEAARVMIAESAIKAERTLDVDPNQISMVLVQLNPDVAPWTVATKIVTNIRGVDVIMAEELSRTVKGQLAGLLQGLLVAGGALWGVSSIMIGAVFSMAVNERKREIGLIRAVGATQRFIFKLITMEGTFLAAMGGILGIIGGGLILRFFHAYMTEALKVPFIMPTTGHIAVMSGISLSIAALIGVLASLYPAFMSSRLDPYTAIRRGE